MSILLGLRATRINRKIHRERLLSRSRAEAGRRWLPGSLCPHRELLTGTDERGRGESPSANFSTTRAGSTTCSSTRISRGWGAMSTIPTPVETDVLWKRIGAASELAGWEQACSSTPGAELPRSQARIGRPDARPSHTGPAPRRVSGVRDSQVFPDSCG